MPDVFRSQDAESDLLEIWLQIARQSTSAADRLLDQINDLCNTLAQYPMMGRSREELAPGLRSFPVRGYTIFYLPTEEGVQIVRVVSASRDINPGSF